MLKHDSPRILSLGVLNLDFVMELGNEMIGKKKMGRQISINAGGHGSSQAIAAVRCGVPTALIGKVGDDAFGQQIQCTLEKEHVDCRFLTHVPNVHSGLATIIIEDHTDNTFIDFLGANYELTNEDIDHCKDAICQADLVMIHMGPAIMDVATHMIELANECHTPVLVTPSVMTADVPLHFWKKVDYLAMNLAQAAAISCLSGENAKTARISASILSNQVRQGVVVHMDGAGVLVAEKGTMSLMDTCFSGEILDYSGATSFFTGVLAAGLVKNSSIQEAAIKAHRAALLCMGKVGVYTSFPSAEVLKTL